jgi:uncharacterized protein
VDVAVTGSSGLIGTALVRSLEADGHRVRRVSRSGQPGAGTVRWDPERGDLDEGALAGVDAVVHLAGEAIAGHRWNDEHKRRVLDSRVKGTTLLAETLARLDPRPAVLVSGSAIGFYGDRGDERLTEDSGPGDGFLATVVTSWELATRAAEEAGIRVAKVRTGLVMARSGGSLKPMLPLFRLGAGGRLGSGRQWWSWISMTDEVAAIRFVLDHDVAGPVNLTGPEPVTNAEFTRVLGRVLHRPAFLPVPRFGPALVLGREAAEEMVFASQRVLPAVLEREGFAFAHRTLEAALRAELGR